MRRQFSLPPDDMEWLESLGHPYELVNEGGVLRVVIRDFRLPAGYSAPVCDVNVRIDAGYPDSQIDMAYFYPPLERADGKPIAAICGDSFDNRTWQRWSRHRTSTNPWRPGVDGLATHFELVRDWLQRELKK